MANRIGQVTLLVNDYDEAVDFYTQKLGFTLLEDSVISNTKRWVLAGPKDSSCCLLLAKAVGEAQLRHVGNQTGGRVFLFLYTDDFWRDYNNYTAAGVKFIRQPTEEQYGIVAVFEDLYGNLWDLIQEKTT